MNVLTSYDQLHQCSVLIANMGAITLSHTVVHRLFRVPQMKSLEMLCVFLGTTPNEYIPCC